MTKKRKKFAYLTAQKIYGGKVGQKTVGIRFEAKSNEALKLARGIIEAVEYGKPLDITIFVYKLLKNGRTRITVTSIK